ncbi:glycerophosphodiester phosphodiesterase [Mycoplasma sp. NEAQ87857]|uniref:glycerophosphodiester phosphodiesterase family protein n=1 Tax=Mycoplasma sp. NEAQ87857 TaxID=2683967 RepID=UPI00131979BC|nr:glycerophosphodiester phosphodiesterase family protein [Mycoplasma sp. NEAQ87857]QGZ97905.1 glycerophosphodiester phosphodiesterase [Mycoplasma sp. NEAQ87857]
MIKKQLLLGHRGYSSIAPENTDLAFNLAHIFGFDGVELDVHLTKDNNLVIIHDEDTKRTANHNHVIKSSSLKTLRTLNYASNFKVTTPCQKLLTLEDFLDKYIDKFKIINIEIKTDVYEYPDIERHIHNLISFKYYEKKDKIVFSSFNFNSLERMHQLDPSYKLGFLWWKHTAFKEIDPLRILEICSFLNPWIDIYDEHAQEYDKFNIPYLLWTLKSEKHYKKYLENPLVYGQISNYKYKEK